MGSGLSLSFVLSAPLGSGCSALPGARLSPAWRRVSDGTDRDFKVGILNEDKRNYIASEQRSGSSPISRDKIG